MTLADLQEIGKMMVASLPVIATLGWFHRQRGERFDRIDRSHAELKAKVDKLDTDVDGLTRQMAAAPGDMERRFLPREDHIASIDRLEHSISMLNQTMGGLSGQLFDLARDAGRGHGPMP